MTPEQLNYLCQNTKCLKPIQSHGYCEVCSVAYGHGYAQGQAGMREAAAKIVEQQGCNEYESAKIKQHGESCPISIAQAIRTLPTEEAPHAEG